MEPLYMVLTLLYLTVGLIVIWANLEQSPYEVSRAFGLALLWPLFAVKGFAVGVIKSMRAGFVELFSKW